MATLGNFSVTIFILIFELGADLNIFSPDYFGLEKNQYRGRHGIMYANITLGGDST